MKRIRALAFLAPPALLACGGGSVSVPENFQPPARPVFSPTGPLPAVRQQRPPPPPAPAALVPPPAPPTSGNSGAGFDQLGTEGGEPAPTPASSRESAPEGEPQRLR